MDPRPRPPFFNSHQQTKLGIFAMEMLLYLFVTIFSLSYLHPQGYNCFKTMSDNCAILRPSKIVQHMQLVAENIYF